MDIKKLRMSRGMTQTELAKLTGISQQHLSQIEKNLIVPTFKTIEKILNSLNYCIEIKEKNNNNI